MNILMPLTNSLYNNNKVISTFHLTFHSLCLRPEDNFLMCLFRASFEKKMKNATKSEKICKDDL